MVLRRKGFHGFIDSLYLPSGRGEGDIIEYFALAQLEPIKAHEIPNVSYVWDYAPPTHLGSSSLEFWTRAASSCRLFANLCGDT